MLKRFFPELYVDSIYDVPYERFYSEGKRNIVFDIDNTLVPFDIPEPTEEVLKLFEKLKLAGFNICLVSNNNERRVSKFNENLKYGAIHKAGKPKLSGIRRAMEMIGAKPENTVLIGDQVFTDVWCGNRCKIYTVLVRPIANRDEFTVKLKRGAEKVVIRIYEKNIKQSK